MQVGDYLNFTTDLVNSSRIEVCFCEDAVIINISTWKASCVKTNNFCSKETKTKIWVSANVEMLKDVKLLFCWKTHFCLEPDTFTHTDSPAMSMHACHSFDDEALSLIQAEGHLLTVLAGLEEFRMYGGGCGGNCVWKTQEGSEKHEGEERKKEHKINQMNQTVIIHPFPKCPFQGYFSILWHYWWWLNHTFMHDGFTMTQLITNETL